MFGRVGLAVVLGACKFTAPEFQGDAPPPIDVSVDLPIDVMSLRVQPGLIGFWTFDDPVGSDHASDTAGGVEVPLAVKTGSSVVPPVFSGGNLIVDEPGRLISGASPHLSMDCINSGGVTLEVWLAPKTAIEGTATSPKFIAGLAKTIGERNIVLLHAGDKWLGRVRTAGGPDDGKPDLLSISTATAGTMTHLVLVADGAQRILYVNDVAEATGVAAEPSNWDPTYTMSLVDEPQNARQWLGTVGLVAMYNRALTDVEVHQNFAAGSSAP